MKNVSLAFIAFFLILGSCEKEVEKETLVGMTNAEEVAFYTPDSINIFGDLYELDKKGKTILLFHQGGSNARGEYAAIIPTLLEKGYNILAIDQRVGGQYYGSYNRTLANIPTNGFGDGYSYCDAYNNLEGALDFIIGAGFSGDKIVWGSSYSAALGIQLANNRSADIHGVLAFSPSTGGSVEDCHPDQYLESLKVPLLILRPPSEMEREGSKIQFGLAQSFNHQTYVAENGVHGSSMLVAERVGNEIEQTWAVVLAFLAGLEN